MRDAAYFKNMANDANNNYQPCDYILLQIEADIEASAMKGDYEVRCLIEAKQFQVVAVIAQLKARGFSVYDGYILSNQWALTIKW